MSMDREPEEPPRVGGVVLCGGRSSRMGQSKALLPVGDEVMLQRVVRILAEVVNPIVIVAAAEQELPTIEIPGRDIRVVRDPVEYRGPLAGLALGLATLDAECEAAYVSACDAPLLRVELVQWLVGQLGTAEIVVPFDGQFHYPLTAVYRTCVRQRIESLLAEDRLRPVFLFPLCDTKEVPMDRLREADPELDSLCNTNTPEEYQRALQKLTQSSAKWPAYTHIPGVTPHPLNDPQGHSFGQHRARREVVASTISQLIHEPECQRGRDLFNQGYYWEAHEEWESLWQSLGRTGPLADFVKGLIKLAAAGVKVREHRAAGVQRHAPRAVELWTAVRATPIGMADQLLLDDLILYAVALLEGPTPEPEDRTGRPIAVMDKLPWPQCFGG